MTMCLDAITCEPSELLLLLQQGLLQPKPAPLAIREICGAVFVASVTALAAIHTATKLAQKARGALSALGLTARHQQPKPGLKHATSLQPGLKHATSWAHEDDAQPADGWCIHAASPLTALKAQLDAAAAAAAAAAAQAAAAEADESFLGPTTWTKDKCVGMTSVGFFSGRCQEAEGKLRDACEAYQRMKARAQAAEAALVLAQRR